MKLQAFSRANYLEIEAFVEPDSLNLFNSVEFFIFGYYVFGSNLLHRGEMYDVGWLYESLERGDYPEGFEAKVQGMLEEYRDAFNLCIRFLKHPRLTWLRGAGRMTERLKGRANLTLTPRAWTRLWLKMLARG